MRVQPLGQGRSPLDGNGNPFQYSCWDNPMDRGAWQTTFHGVAKNMVEEIQHSHMQKTKILHAAQIGKKMKVKDQDRNFSQAKRGNLCAPRYTVYLFALSGLDSSTSGLGLVWFVWEATSASQLLTFCFASSATSFSQLTWPFFLPFPRLCL